MFSGLFLWLALFAVASVLFNAFLPRIKGGLGEVLVNVLLRMQLDSKEYHLIPNVILPTKDGTTQIDHVIVSRFGIFVLETKNYKGWIFGNEKDAQWTQQLYRHRNRFQNPLRQNYLHTRTLADLTGIHHDYFKPVVVFLGEATFKTTMPSNVVYAGNCVRYIRSFSSPVIKASQVPEITSAIREWAATVSAEKKRTHATHVRSKKEPVSTNASQPVTGQPSCPNCQSTMVSRQNRKTGEPFWGCPRYPACRGIVRTR